MRLRLTVLSFMLLLLAPPALNAQIAASGSASSAACIDVVRDFYTWYASKGFAAPEGWIETILNNRSGQFSPSLLRLFRQYQAAPKKGDGEITGIDYDPFLNAQDTDEAYSFGKTTIKGDTCSVEVHSVSQGQPSATPNVVPELQFQNGKWIFVNFHYPEARRPENENLVGVLRGFLPPPRTTQSADTAPDPMKELSNIFPDTVAIKNKGRLLEFCPDGTCDGFVATGNLSVSALKDFAYLYVYFFSDYTFLDEFRSKEVAKYTADQILAKPQYKACKNESSREAARCVLRDLSKGGRIKLIFVRYDEGERHAVSENLAGRLSEK